MNRTNRKTSKRQGIASVLAMLFLVLFSMLALGFYASVTTSVQVSGNQQRTNKARLAAESGIQFMRYHLANVDVPGTSTDVIGDLYADLKADLEGSTNLGSNTVSCVGTGSNKVIYIPAEPGAYIVTNAQEKTGFTATIKEWDGGVICTVAGRNGQTAAINTKSVSLEFNRKTIPYDVFDYAVAAKGSVAMVKGSLVGVNGVSADDIAKIMSAKVTGTSINMSGGTVGGELNIVSPGVASVTGGSVHGTTNISTIMNNYVKAVSAPTFPVFDTTAFKDYATNTYTSGSTLSNVRIPANTNPVFTGGATIQGIMYVESPNTIQFRGNVQLNGFIVVENKNDSSQNMIDMRGNFTWGTLPPGAEYDSMRSTTGIAIMAPTTAMTMSGSAESTLKGNIILGKFATASNAGDVTIDQGTLLTLDAGTSAIFNGKNLKFKATGKLNQPAAGIIYGATYEPVAGKFQELD